MGERPVVRLEADRHSRSRRSVSGCVVVLIAVVCGGVSFGLLAWLALDMLGGAVDELIRSVRDMS